MPETPRVFQGNRLGPFDLRRNRLFHYCALEPPWIRSDDSPIRQVTFACKLAVYGSGSNLGKACAALHGMCLRPGQELKFPRA